MSRLQKVNQLLKKELAGLIEEEFTGQLITVAEIDTAADLKSARVWISVFNQDEEKTLKQLSERAADFQGYLGKRLFIKNIPRLTFLLDKSFERVAKIEKLLK